MKTTNVSPSGMRAADTTRGRVSPTRASSTGMVIGDAAGSEVGPSQKALFVGATVSGDADTAYITISGTGQQATNDSGAALEYGDVVVLQADGTVTTTTTAQDTRPVGVVQVPAANGDPAAVVFSGYVAQVNTTASVTAGNYAETSTSAGDATENATPRAGSFGVFVGTGANPPALLFGQTYLTGGGSGGGGVPGWFNVTDYGAVGDGSTDDTAAINLAIAAVIAASGGVLYFPQGTYKVTSALTTVSVGCLVLGDGGARTGAVTTINFTSTTGTLLTFSANGCEVRDIFFDQTGGTATAGGCLSFTTAKHAKVTGCGVIRYYVGIFADQPVYFTADNNYVSNTLYGFQIRNTTDPDQGDWALTRNTIVPGASGAGIRIESSGGGRIENNKINANNAASSVGIQLAFASGTTAALLIQGNSIENTKSYGIDITLTGTARWKNILIAGNEFGLWGNTATSAINANSNTAGYISELVITGNEFNADANAQPAITLTKVDNARISGNVRSGYASLYSATTCTNIVDDSGAIAGEVLITGTPSAGQVPVAASGTSAPWTTPWATPAVVLGTAAAAGSATTGIRSDSTIVAFDATVPVTQAYSDAAATGSAAVAARRDHRHGMPASGSGIGEILISDTPSTPLVFADLLQNEAQDDLLYADP